MRASEEANRRQAADIARLYTEVQREKRYFEALVQNSPAAVVTIDRRYRIVSWNASAERLFGYTEAEALGQNIDDLIAAPILSARKRWPVHKRWRNKMRSAGSLPSVIAKMAR